MVTAFLATMPALRQATPATYHGLDALSGVWVLLLDCDQAGNYDDKPSETINRVELVCSCNHPERDHEWEALAGRIAEFLAWEVVDDQTGEVLRARPSTEGT
jgi:hypothetical protein